MRLSGWHEAVEGLANLRHQDSCPKNTNNDTSGASKEEAIWQANRGNRGNNIARRGSSQTRGSRWCQVWSKTSLLYFCHCGFPSLPAVAKFVKDIHVTFLSLPSPSFPVVAVINPCYHILIIAYSQLACGCHNQLNPWSCHPHHPCWTLCGPQVVNNLQHLANHIQQQNSSCIDYEITSICLYLAWPIFLPRHFWFYSLLFHLSFILRRRQAKHIATIKFDNPAFRQPEKS